MSFFKKLFGSNRNTTKNNTKESIEPLKKNVNKTPDNTGLVEDFGTIEAIIKREDKPEILCELRVRLTVGGDKELNKENAFITMGISDENLKNQILEWYIWQSYGDLDSDFNCTMKLVRLDVQEKHRPNIDGETALITLFSRMASLDSDQKPNETEIKAHPDLEKFKKVPWMTDLRLKNVSICLNAGFRPSNSLPTEFEQKLRPSIEIAKRLHAIKAFVLWLWVPEENMPSENVLSFINKNQLKEFMTNDEINIFNASRLDNELRNSISWKLENAWPLAWYFGYIEPNITGQRITEEEIKGILFNYMCDIKEDLDKWVETKKTVTENEIKQKEDLFYCLHNAVRSAQLGRETVPKDFDPIINGAVIHERRHSLTWMLSDGISWPETDLSS